MAPSSFAASQTGQKLLVAQRDSVDVAENHYAGKLKLLHGAAQFSHRRRRIAKRQGSQRSEQSAFIGNDAGKSVIHKPCQPHGRRSAFYVRAGRSQSDDLGVNAGFFYDLFAIFNVAMAGHSHVVIARVMQAGISGRVMRNADRARSLFNGLDVFRWIEMVMKVDRWHSCLVLCVRSRVVLRWAQKKYTGSPIRSKPRPMKLSRGAAHIWFMAMAADVTNEMAGSSG